MRLKCSVNSLWPNTIVQLADGLSGTRHTRSRKQDFGGRKPVRRLSVLVALALSLVACAGSMSQMGPIGTSDLEVLPPAPRDPPPEGYKPKLGRYETIPEVQVRDLPSYPEGGLADEISCTARLLYHIQKDGSVALVRLQWDEPPPTDHQAVFEQSIRDAIAGWRYTPGKKWVPTKMQDGSTRLVPQAIPKAEKAIVRFRVKEGQAIVE